MAGLAAARALRPGPAYVVSGFSRTRDRRFELALAAAADEAHIRALLREPLAGDVSISLEREPDSGVAARIEGDVHQTLVARERATGRIAAIASRSVRDAFINGVPARLGYLGQLRIAPEFRRSRTLLEEGFAFCRELHDAGDARVYLTSVVGDNHRARRLLLGTRSTSAPQLMPAGALITVVLGRSLLRRSMANYWQSDAAVEIREGSLELLAEIAACLRRHGARHQFAPCWPIDELCVPGRTPDLRPEDFLVAMRRGRAIGCLACWDQRRFKQVIVRGYSSSLARWRPLINIAAPWLGIPRLPQIGRPMNFAYLSHFAVDDDEAETATALMAAARERLPRDLDYLVTAFAEGSPLLPAVRRRFRHREYRSDLYLAWWPDGERAARAIDQRLPHPEVAIV